MAPRQSLFFTRAGVMANRSDARTVSSAHVGAYLKADGEFIANTGDEDAQYAKAPPFPSVPYELGVLQTLTATHAPEGDHWPLLNAEPFRSATFTFLYKPAQSAATLNLIFYNVQVGKNPDYSDAVYFPLAFAAPTPTTSLAQAPYQNTFLVRQTAPVVFTVPATTTAQAIMFSLSLDGAGFPAIGGLSALTFSAMEAVSGSHGTLRAWVSLAV